MANRAAGPLANRPGGPYIGVESSWIDGRIAPPMNMVLRKVAGFTLLVATLGVASCQALFVHAF
jgi:hypothetical protein